jgi:hypothetical protein
MTIDRINKNHIQKKCSPSEIDRLTAGFELHKEWKHVDEIDNGLAHMVDIRYNPDVNNTTIQFSEGMDFPRMNYRREGDWVQWALDKIDNWR